MKTTIYSLGTVVKIEDATALIVGYGFEEKNDRLVPYYQIVPYPTGYRGSIKQAGISDVKIIEEGYHSDIAKLMTQHFATLSDFAQDIPADQMTEYINQSWKAIQEGKK